MKMNGYVPSLDVYNGNLYCGGGFDSVNASPAINYILSWNGTAFSSVGSGMNSFGYVLCMANYNGFMYAGGLFTSAGGKPANYVAQWNGVAGINELYNAEEIKVYPNPSNGKFAIESLVVSGQSSVEVYNMMGEKVYSGFLNEQESEIDLSGQASGIYMYRILSATGQPEATGKLVIQQ